MNFFNRILIIVFSLVAILFWVWVLFVLWARSDQLVEALRDLAFYLRTGLGTVRAVVTFLGAAIIILALLLLAAELAPQESTVKVKSDKGAEARVTLDSLAAAVKQVVEWQPGVRSAKPTLHSRGDSVGVRVDVRLDPRYRAPDKAHEISQEMRNTLEGQLGVKMGRSTVNILYEPLGKETVAPPTAEEPAQDNPQPAVEEKEEHSA